jgi:hypothetical protein
LALVVAGCGSNVPATDSPHPLSQSYQYVVLGAPDVPLDELAREVSAADPQAAFASRIPEIGALRRATGRA